MKTISVKVMVHNLPKDIEPGYIVARYDETELWYYGTYETWIRACEVVCELQNGVILEVENGNDD